MFSIRMFATRMSSGLAWLRPVWMLGWALVLCVMGTAPAAAQATYFATPSGTGSGSSWADAASIEDATDQAGPGDTIKLQKGRYLLTERLHTAAQLIGGYPGADEAEDFDPFPNPTTASSIDPDTDATTLDGQGQTGLVRFYGGGALNVAFQNGQARRGGGLLVEDPPADVELRRIQLLQNTATEAGGGLFVASGATAPAGAVRLEASKLVGNTASVGGQLHIEGEAAHAVVLNTFDGGQTQQGQDYDVTFLDAPNATLVNNIAEHVGILDDAVKRAIITQRVVGEQQYEAGDAPEPTDEVTATIDGTTYALNPEGDTLRVMDGYSVELNNQGSTDFIERFSAYNEHLGQDTPGQPIPQDWKGGEIPRQVDYAAGPTADNPDASPNIIIPSSEIEDLKELQVQLIPSVSPEGKNTVDTYAFAVNDPEDDRSGIFIPRTTPSGDRFTDNGDDLNRMVTYILNENTDTGNNVPQEELDKWRNAVELVSAEYPYDVEIREASTSELQEALIDRSTEGDVFTAQNINYLFFTGSGTPGNTIRPPTEYLKTNSLANVVEGEDTSNRFTNEYHESMNGKDDFFEVYDIVEGSGVVVPNEDMNFMIQLYYTTNGSL